MWCFAKINNQLSEIFFDENKNGEKAILGHCDVEAKEYKTKKEKEWIRKDTKKFVFSYENKKYYDKSDPRNLLKNTAPYKTKRFRKPSKTSKTYTLEEMKEKLKL